MRKLILWTVRILAAVIMLQTLYFKFSGAEESVYIFSTLGMEPWGRIAVGIGELIAGVLLLIPVVSWLGAIAGVGLMSGAIFFHLAILGVEVQNDGGFLFFLAVVVWVCCTINLYLSKVKLHRNWAKIMDMKS